MLEAERGQLSAALEEARRARVVMETEMEVERGRLDQERRKSALLQDQIRDLVGGGRPGC